MGGISRAALGRWGEGLIADYLRVRGWQIVAAGWRCRFGEIDLVAENEKYIAFTEVKLRKNAVFAPARAYVDVRKQEKLRISASLYLAEHPTERQPRFDVAEVYAPQGTSTQRPKVLYYENAF